MSTRQRNGHDYLTFASTELNQGPGTLVVDGFRGTNDRSMDAFQYFLIDGEPIGRAPVGELEFHAGRHNHWHFQQFALYSLLDADSKHVIVSDKQSWCLVNTDALDLTVPNANLTTRGLELRTSCGGPKALWIREVLDVGWADTYGQGVGSGAFDITGLRNGTYYVRVQVNPLGSLFEADTSNNVQDRLIQLRGKPGHRRVIVLRWHGIDTENACDYC
jgi:Lysyl oxidase